MTVERHSTPHIFHTFSRRRKRVGPLVQSSQESYVHEQGIEYDGPQAALWLAELQGNRNHQWARMTLQNPLSQEQISEKASDFRETPATLAKPVTSLSLSVPSALE